jgi:hypothetical protein
LKVAVVRDLAGALTVIESFKQGDDLPAPICNN